MKLITKQKNKGFTLLEALVAISILMVAVAAPITIAQKGLSSAVFSKDQMIASYLAQDAIEYIKNRRDVATINDPYYDWAGFLAEFSLCLGQGLGGGTCQIDTIANNNNVAEYSSANKLNKDNDGFYTYESGTPTKFNRKVEMMNDPFDTNSNEILITVTMNWGTSDNTEVVVKTLIYNY